MMAFVVVVVVVAVAVVVVVAVAVAVELPSRNLVKECSVLFIGPRGCVSHHQPLQSN
jgi:hypothetical protein